MGIIAHLIGKYLYYYFLELEFMGSCGSKAVPCSAESTLTKREIKMIDELQKLFVVESNRSSKRDSGYDMLDVFLLYELPYLLDDSSDVYSVEIHSRAPKNSLS